MVSDCRAFEEAYGREVPPTLKAMYDDRELLSDIPLRIVLPGQQFVVEIQYFRSVTELVPEDVALQRFAFAVSSDGFDMLVELSEPDLPVLQREFGDVDHLDFTLVEFLAAARLRTVR